jgi:uncharacterized membrane protein
MKKLFGLGLVFFFVLLLCGQSMAASIGLAWDPVDGASGYRIYYGTQTGEYTHQEEAGSSTSHSVANLTAGAQYYFVATAYDADGYESGYSNEVSATTVTPLTYSVNAYALTTGGFVSPAGATNVTQGGNLTITITTETGYVIVDVQVDGVSVGPVSSYTFSNVQSNHTISVSFAPISTAYRFRNVNTNAYLFTANESEKSSIIANYSWLYAYEGIAFYVYLSPQTGTVPAYRFRNVNTNAYLFTANESEKSSIIANYSWLYAYEGIAFYVYLSPQTGTVPAYRFRNVNTNAYLFTANESEKSSIIANYSWLYAYEGIAFYVK